MTGDFSGPQVEMCWLKKKYDTKAIVIRFIDNIEQLIK